MADKWDFAPVQERALRLSIQSLQAVEGECLDDLENPIDYLESVSLVLHEVARVTKPRPLADYHEDYGFCLWWKLPVCEPPYAGSPNCSDWPGYHTHFTAMPQVLAP